MRHKKFKNLLPRRRFLSNMGLGTLGFGSVSCATQFGSNTATTLPISSEPIASDKSNSSEIKPVATNIESNEPKLPDFQGITQWLNSNLLTIKDLKGNVVLVQFWTFSCINCQRTNR